MNCISMMITPSGRLLRTFTISRQAVYEHIKRAELTLQEYESKLHLVHKHEQRMKLRRRLGSGGLNDCDTGAKEENDGTF